MTIFKFNSDCLEWIHNVKLEWMNLNAHDWAFRGLIYPQNIVNVYINIYNTVYLLLCFLLCLCCYLRKHTYATQHKCHCFPPLASHVDGRWSYYSALWHVFVDLSLAQSLRRSKFLSKTWKTAKQSSNR